MRRVLGMVLLVAVTVSADASFQAVRAQCAPGSKILIDPRLVPLRTKVSHQQAIQAAIILGSNPNDPVALDTYNAYTMQNQPIEISATYSFFAALRR
jgi:hypothetical protein